MAQFFGFQGGLTDAVLCNETDTPSALPNLCTSTSKQIISQSWNDSTCQWEFQDPNMEVLYHIRPYFAGIFPYIGLILYFKP